MDKNNDFLNIERKEIIKRPIKERVTDYKEVKLNPAKDYGKEQAQRCMQCGTPFCSYSCPLNNLCPEWHYFIRNENWKEALLLLEKTNNFPEFTGRLCPAICEGGCVLGINDDSVTIKNIELLLAEKGWEEGWIKPQPPEVRTGKKVAVIGSGPAGLAAAQQLNRVGHWVVVYEKDDSAGGMMRYGIPDFKIEKDVLERRIKQLEEEGIKFKFNIELGKDHTAKELTEEYDAIVLATGARKARELAIPGSDLDGIYQAMDFLTEQNKRVAGRKKEEITAAGKKVLVIGGGDTGADCVGTAVRQGAEAVYQIELLEKPPENRTADNPWPEYPQTLKVGSSHQEAEKVLGIEEDELRKWSILSKRFRGDKDGRVAQYYAKRIDWIKDESGEYKMKESDESLTMEIDMVILAIGFVGTKENTLLSELNIKTEQGKVVVNNYKTNNQKVFAAGDIQRGPSLIVWAIKDGREVARKVNEYLKK